MKKLEIVRSVLEDLNKDYEGVSINLIGCVLRGGSGPRCSYYENHKLFGSIPYLPHKNLLETLEILVNQGLVKVVRNSTILKYAITRQSNHQDLLDNIIEWTVDDEEVEEPHIGNDPIESDSIDNGEHLENKNSVHAIHISTAEVLREREHLAHVIAKINERIDHIWNHEMYHDVKPSDTASDYDSIEDLYMKKQSNKHSEEEISELKKMISTPYFGRMDLMTEDNVLMKMYIGKRKFKIGKDCIVYDWRSRLAHQYYDQDDKMFVLEEQKYTLIRKRRFDIQSSVLVSVFNEFDSQIHDEVSDSIIDPFLQRILLENRGKPGFSDIISTIQQKQFEIIKQPLNQSFIVQGCAGSGKTMVMFHRLSYLLFNNSIDLNVNLVRIITPGDLYQVFVNSLVQDLDISKAEMSTIHGYYLNALAEYKMQPDDAHQDETMFDSEYLKEIYCLDFFNDIDREIKECLVKMFVSAIHREFEAIKKLPMTFRILAKKIEEKKSKISDAEKAIIMKYPNPYSVYNENASVRIQAIIESASSAIKEEVERLTIMEAETVLIRQMNKKIEFLHGFRNDVNEVVDFGDKSDDEAFEEPLARAFIEKAFHRVQNKYESLIEKSQTTIKELKKRQLSESLLIETQVILKEYTNLKPMVDYVQKLEMELETLQKSYDDKISSKTEIIRDAMDRFDILSRTEIDPMTLFERMNSELSEMYEEGVIGRSTIEILKTAQSVVDAKILHLEERYPLANIDVKLYKHYAYMMLQVLVRIKKPEQRYKFMFVDEAQDLSEGEYDLLERMNPGVVLNLFGDSMQVITKHGLKSWDVLNQIDKLYTLKENYRNPNEVIELCNQYLRTQMNHLSMPGCPIHRIKSSEFVDIVSGLKTDDWALIYRYDDDLLFDSEVVEDLFEGQHIMTVHASKGLEFNTIFVIDKSMNSNEKYIAYTRALERLVIIS